MLFVNIVVGIVCAGFAATDIQERNYASAVVCAAIALLNGAAIMM